MICLRKPSPEQLGRYLARQADSPLGYAPAGLTRRGGGGPIARQDLPPGYATHHQSESLGAGEAAYEAARAGLLRWAQMPPTMLEVFPVAGSAKPGAAIALVIRSLGLWWVNSARVLFVEETEGAAIAGGEQDGERVFALTYGTLPDHLERGEERFAIRQAADGTVWYDLTVVWRGNKLLARLAPWMVRREQARFRRLSVKALREAVQKELAATTATEISV